MSFKKTAVSYAIWILFIMCNCVIFAFLSIMCAKLLPIPVPVGAVVISATFFGLLLLIYFLAGRISNFFAGKEPGVEAEKRYRRRVILEGIFVILIFAAGIGIRVYTMPYSDGASAYFDAAKVTQGSNALIVPVQNSIYYYICLLGGLFLVLGNHWLAGIWLQIILQAAGSVIFYFVIRKFAGIFAAVCSLAYIMFSPAWLEESLKYSPQMLYFFIWSVGFLLIMLYMNSSAKCGERELSGYRLRMWSGTVLLGLALGFITYMDVSGVTLLIPVLFLAAVCRKSNRPGIWAARTGCVLFLGISSFGLFLFVDSLLSGATFMGVLYAWLETYRPEIPNIIAVLQSSNIEVFILLLVMSLNIFSFYRRKEQEIVTPWILMTVLFAALYLFGMTTESMNGRCILMMLMCVVGAISIRQLFYVNTVDEHGDSMEEVDDGITIEQIDNEIVTENVVSEVKADAQKEMDSEMLEKTRYIENPLPLPKKHVKRVMDFTFTPEEDMMKYDIEVSDSDNFDI